MAGSGRVGLVADEQQRRTVPDVQDRRRSRTYHPRTFQNLRPFSYRILHRAALRTTLGVLYCPTCQSYPGYPGRGWSQHCSPAVHPRREDQLSAHSQISRFGMGITAMFGGPGLTRHIRQLFSYVLRPLAESAANNPGKRISAADFTYRMPGMRNWLTFYLDSLVVDEISPIGSTRANVNPGIYMPRYRKSRSWNSGQRVLTISAPTNSCRVLSISTTARYRSVAIPMTELAGELDWQGRPRRSRLADILVFASRSSSVWLSAARQSPPRSSRVAGWWIIRRRATSCCHAT